jgi:AbrB family looped-hinge helix DNA binding protein
MEQIVSITKQGQVTIPKEMRDAFGIHGAVKAFVQKLGDTIVIKPKKDFWSLSGSLRSNISLSDKQLQETRKDFQKNWPRKK